MKAMDLLVALNDVDEKCLRTAKQDKTVFAVKKVWKTIGSLVACLLILAIIPLSFIVLNDGNGGGYDGGNMNGGASPPPGNGVEIAPVYADATIYFVDGDSIGSEVRNMRLFTLDIFKLWKEYNDIGAEVELISAKIDDNGKTTDLVDGTVSYQPGDYIVLTITVSKNLEEYYSVKDSKLLLESLKLTMTGYLDIEFDEYILVLE